MNLGSFAVLSSAAALALVLSAYPAAAGSRPLTEPEINALIEIYAPEGYARGDLQKIFKDPRVRYLPNPVKMLVMPPDFSASYERFSTQAEIEKARAFRTSWRTELEAAATTCGVDPDIIVAILLVETSLGQHLGRSPVLSVFASLLLANGLHRDDFVRLLDGNPRRDHYLQRLDDKAAWAEKELRALITMSSGNAIDVCGLRGSYAGAFGIAQFLPTSYLKWAHSGPDERRPDLFYMPHAIMSVANFLKEHGWKTNLTDFEKRMVIWHYNRSSVYIDTVLAVAEQLKKDGYAR